jgi:hypothetical protein
LSDTTHRQEPGIPRLEQQLLQFVCCPDLSTLCRLVNPLLEAEDMPMDLRPWDLLPGHHQGLAILCFGSLPLTHRFTFQNTGPTSAYPGRYSWPWLLRASSSPPACGGHLLWKVTSLPKSCWRSSRTQARATLGREFPISTLSIVERVPSPSLAHVSCILSKIPYIEFSPVRLQTEASCDQPYPSRSPHGLKPQVGIPP